jgi:hypothetical protein
VHVDVVVEVVDEVEVDDVVEVVVVVVDDAGVITETVPEPKFAT